jgi:hypothetical protein
MKSKLILVTALSLIVGATSLLESSEKSHNEGVVKAPRAGGSHTGSNTNVARGASLSGTVAGRAWREKSGGRVRFPGGGKHITVDFGHRNRSYRNHGKRFRGGRQRHDRHDRGHWGFRSGGYWGPYILGAGVAGYPDIDYEANSPYEDCYYDSEGFLVCQVEDNWYYAE